MTWKIVILVILELPEVLFESIDLSSGGRWTTEMVLVLLIPASSAETVFFFVLFAGWRTTAFSLRSRKQNH
jgi:hypothetical protein